MVGDDRCDGGVNYPANPLHRRGFLTSIGSVAGLAALSQVPLEGTARASGAAPAR
jgi:hypothetical protein